MQPSAEMMSYQNPPIIKKDGTAVPLGMTITPPMMTTAGQRSKRMIAIVAAGVMLVVAGGAVLMLDGGSAYNHLSGSGSIASTAEGLVVAPPKKCGSCYGAGTNVTLCCNTCDDVQQAYDNKDWIAPNLANIVQCNATQIEEAEQTDDGAIAISEDNH